MSDFEATDFSLADFQWNDNPDVLSPPTDFAEWKEDPRIEMAFRLYEQELKDWPSGTTTMRSSIDGEVRDVINLTSYNYLGLSTHPEVLEAAKAAADEYGMSASGSAMLSGTFDLHTEFAEALADFKGKEATADRKSVV